MNYDLLSAVAGSLVGTVVGAGLGLLVFRAVLWRRHRKKDPPARTVLVSKIVCPNCDYWAPYGVEAWTRPGGGIEIKTFTADAEVGHGYPKGHKYK